MMQGEREDFDITIGRLDNVLSKLILYAERTNCQKGSLGFIDTADRQTLKHHAEDMIGASNKILELIKTNEGAVR